MNKKIFIIDDERSEFVRLKSWLEDYYPIFPDDYSEMAKAVDPFCEGEGIKEYVIRQIKENYKDIGLILCDIVGYGEDASWGPDIIESIKSLIIPESPNWASQVPIIALTQYAEDIQVGVTRKGATTVRSKPTTDTEKEIIKELIESQISIFEKNITIIEKYTIMNKPKEKVFIVHGHDVKVKETVARFLEKLDLDAVILHEKPNYGDTIIEKIERYAADVSYAVILYTGCDLGKATNETDFKPRARQNVVFEHGYMISKLGREKVCALVDKDVIPPGDLAGVVFVQFDEGKGNWKAELVNNMQSIGIKIDPDKLLRALCC